MIQTFCKKCGKLVRVKKYRFKESGNFCSRNCLKNGKNCTCNSCGKIFYRKLSLIRSSIVFCSKDCCNLKNLFKQGGAPWNKNLQEIRRKPPPECQDNL